MIARRTVLLLPLFAAACSSDDAPVNFSTPSYSYLTPLRLNVASIDQAWIHRVGDALEGRMSVHLDIYAGGESRVGFAEAQVARRRVSTDTSENPRVVLYNFVTQMMSDMNVEFEFQVRRSLKEYLQDTATAVPTPAPVQSQDLAPPAPLAPPRGSAPPASAPPTGILRRPAGY
jgi:hypothetical protein